MQNARTLLPIYPARDALINNIKQHSCVIIVGETGSGKSTQIPQYLFESNMFYGIIGVTQPRRVAAIALANRVAEEMNVRVGHDVGYTIRFDDRTCNRTRIKYMTDGMLLREIHNDKLLSKYSVIILDEAHERTLQTDILFALIKGILRKRRQSEFHVVIMSATLNANMFTSYFNDNDGIKPPPVLYISGRQYPVQIMYCEEPQSDYIDAVIKTCIQIHSNTTVPGDILVFLTGQDEIETTRRLLLNSVSSFPKTVASIIITPIFSALPSSEQMKVFETTPANCRKIVLATNIAETSVTIDGIQYIVDPGVVKIRQHHPKSGIESLTIVPISQSEAWQRSGRAGRSKSGVCYRLYTENTFLQLREALIPEIHRCNLATVILQLKALKINDIMNFDFIDRPPKSSLIRSLQHLYALDALDDTGSLTPLGKHMALLPLEPVYSRTLIASKEYGCTCEILTIISMLSVESIFYMPSVTQDERRNKAMNAKRKFSSIYGDHILLLNVYNAYKKVKTNVNGWCKENFINARSMKKVMQIRQQLVHMCGRVGLNPDDELQPHDNLENIRKCLVKGLFLQVACLQHDSYTYTTLIDQQNVYIHPSSSLMNIKPRPACIIYTELLSTSKQYIRDITVIDMIWLTELVPKFYEYKT